MVLERSLKISVQFSLGLGVKTPTALTNVCECWFLGDNLIGKYQAGGVFPPFFVMLHKILTFLHCYRLRF